MKKFTEVPIREVQAYWDKKPCNIRHSPRVIGTKEYFDEVEKRKYHVESHIPLFAQFDLWHDKDVLEIGCGIGTDAINFARAGARVIAIDISHKSIALARRRAKIFGLNNIKFRVGDAEELPQFLPPTAYDLIYSFGTIHHTPNPERLIQQLLYYAHPKTILKIMTYNRYSWRVLQILLTSGTKFFREPNNLIAEHSEAQKDCPVTYTFSKGEIKKLLERNGFRIKEIRIDHIFPYNVPHYRRYEYRKAWYFKCMPIPVFRILEKLIGWHICITAEVK